MQDGKAPRQGKGRGVLLAVGICLAVGVIGWLYASGGRAQVRRPGGRRAVSVTTAVARRGDVPVTLTGIGTVTPLKNVTVRSRVDGELLEVRFREGQMVQEGELMARIDPRPFEAQKAQYQGQLARDKALLANARRDLVRYRNLVRKDVLARQTMDTQASLVSQYEGAVRSDEAQIRAAGLQIEYSRITAPISGRVGLRLVDPGNMVRTSDQTGLFVITQVTPISVLFTLPEDDLPAVRERLAADHTLPVAAFDRTMSRKLAEGVLTTTDNRIDTSTGTVRLRAAFENADDSLFPNQFVNAVMTLKILKNAILVPAAAVQRGPKGATVFVVRQGGAVASRSVTTGMSVGQDLLIASGLSGGETVVVEGANRLRDGTPVTVRNPTARAGKKS